MNKKITEDLSKFVDGVRLVAKQVGSTMGAKGKNVLIDKGYGAPIPTNDGAIVAENTQSEDEQENLGCEAIKAVAKEVAKEAGDSTSATVVIGEGILIEGLKYPLSNEIRESLNQTKDFVIKHLKDVSRPIKTRKDLLDVAVTSVENQELGEIIVNLYQNLGDTASISVETKIGPGIEVEISEGYEIKKGMVHTQMATQGKEAILNGAKCLVVTGNLMLMSELLPFLQKLVNTNIKELVIFCENIDAGLVNFFLANKGTGFFNGVVVRVQSINNELLEDIALVTGATLVRRDTGQAIETLDTKVLGQATKILSDSSKTIIFGGKGKMAIKTKIKELKDSLQTEKNENSYDLIEDRIARLSNSVGVIRVGSNDEAETNYLKDKIDDAVAAVRSAKEEGIVEGGGMALYRISGELDNSTIGNKIMKKALTYPLRNILKNADLDYTDILINLPKDCGYDVKNMKYANMFKAGIADTHKGLRCAVEKTVSFAGTILTSGHLNYIKKDEKND